MRLRRGQARSRCPYLVVVAVSSLALAGCVRHRSQPPNVSIMGPLAVSHDGRYVALWTSLTSNHDHKSLGNQMFVYDTQLNDIAYKADDAGGFRRPLAWHPRRQELLFFRFLWSAPGTSELSTLVPDEKKPKEVAVPGLRLIAATWSPDGTEIVCRAMPVAGKKRTAIYRFVQDTGQIHMVGTGTQEGAIEAVRPAPEEGYLIFLRHAHNRPRDEGYDWSYSVAWTAAGRTEQVIPRDWHVWLEDVSSDGRTVLMRHLSQADAGRQLSLLEWQESDVPTSIDHIDDEVLESLFSPDDDQILCVGRDALWLWSLRKAALRRLSFSEWQPAHGHQPVAWVPGEYRIAVGAGSRLFLVDPGDGRASQVLDLSLSAGLTREEKI